MRFIYGLCVGFLVSSIALAEEPQPSTPTYQATLRGSDTTGAVVFSAPQSREVSGDAVIFHQGGQFVGKSKGTIEEGRLVLTFETAATSDESAVKGISGSIEAPMAVDPVARKFAGTGSIVLSSRDSNARKFSAQRPIKAEILRLPPAVSPK